MAALSGIGVPIPCIKIASFHATGRPPTEQFILGPKKQGFVLSFGGEGQSFGIYFKRGGFFPFTGNSLRELHNHGALLPTILPAAPLLPPTPWTMDSAQIWYDSVTNFLISCLPNLHRNHLPEITQVIDILLANPEMNRIEVLLGKANISKRTLQRMFTDEVGLSIRDVMR